MRKFNSKKLILGFEALWRKILPPDLKTLVYFFLLTLYFGATIGQ